MENVVDIGKARLDAYRLRRQRRLTVDHDAAGIERLAGAGQPGRDGSVRRLRAAAARGRGRARARGRRRQARDFAEASGVLAETDRVDAAVIARHGAFARPAPTPVPDAPRRRLAGLPAYRRRLPAGTAARARQLGHPRTPAPVERARAALDRLRRGRAGLGAPVGRGGGAGPRAAAAPP